MRVTREFDLGGVKVNIVELTLGEIRAWLKDVATASPDPEGVVDALLFDDFDPAALLRMTDLSREQLDAFTPTDLRKLAAECREVNADFFAMRQRMAAAQRQMLSAISSVPH